MANWRSTRTPGVYVAHSTHCPAFDDADARCRCTPSWRGRRWNGATGRAEWQRPVVKDRVEVLTWLGAVRDGLSRSRIAGHASVASAIYAWGISPSRRYATRNPLRLVELPPNDEKPRLRVALAHEATALLAALDELDALPYANAEPTPLHDPSRRGRLPDKHSPDRRDQSRRLRRLAPTQIEHFSIPETGALFSSR